MSWDDNPYSNPENFGLTPVKDVDLAGSYEFDIFAVWTDGKTLYWAKDSGCSCPMPFEDFNGIGDLCVGSVEECLRAIDNWSTGSWYGRTKAQVAPLRDAVREWGAGRALIPEDVA